MRFTVVKDFYSEELQSHYVAGLSYAPGPQDHRLRELIKQWLAEGRIVEGGGAAVVSGKE
jgi:hypothetical protein